MLIDTRELSYGPDGRFIHPILLDSTRVAYTATKITTVTAMALPMLNKAEKADPQAAL